MANYSPTTAPKPKLHATIEVTNMKYLQALKKKHEISLSQAVDMAIKIAREIQSDELAAERIADRVCQKMLKKLKEMQ